MTKNIVYIIKPFNNQLNRIKVKKFNVIKNTFKFKDKMYIIDSTMPLLIMKMHWYDSQLTRVYCYDLERGQMITDISKMNKEGQLVLTNQNTTINPDFIDDIFNNEIVRQLTAAIGKSGIFDMSIIGMIIILICGLLGGIILGQYIDFGVSSGGP
jgi:hypothetical protein